MTDNLTTNAGTQLSRQSWQHHELGALVLSRPWQSSFAQLFRQWPSGPVCARPAQFRSGAEMWTGEKGQGQWPRLLSQWRENQPPPGAGGKNKRTEKVLHLGGRGASEPGWVLGKGGGVRSGVTDRPWHHWQGRWPHCRHEHGLWDELLHSAGRKPRSHAVSGSCGWVRSSGKFPRFTMLNYIYSYSWLNYIPFMAIPHSEFPLITRYTLWANSAFRQSWAMSPLYWWEFLGSFLKTKDFSYNSFPRAWVWEKTDCNT